jgi:hypothetical protein
LLILYPEIAAAAAASTWRSTACWLQSEDGGGDGADRTSLLSQRDSSSTTRSRGM